MDKTLSTAELRHGKEFIVRRLDSEQIDFFWPSIDIELEKIRKVWETWWTKEALYQRAMNNDFQVWVVGTETRFHLVVFTQILVYPANKILQCVLAFGTKLPQSIEPLNATLEDFADIHSCTVCEVVGRVGWKKVLEQIGFEGERVVMVKKLKKLRRH